MKSFKSFILNEEELSDDKHVHRIDNTKISDFSSNMNTYHHKKDWTESALLNKEDTPKKGWKKSTGVFATDAHSVAPYASPRGTNFVQHYDQDGNSQLAFDEKDKEKIKAHRPIVSSFPKERFKHIETSGESFSENPGKPEKQSTIKNPVKFMQQNGHNVQFVPDLKDYKRNLEKNKIEHNSEGL
jgi:hypothetical protein